MKKTKFSSKSNPEEHGWGLLYVKEIVDFQINLTCKRPSMKDRLLNI